MVDIRWPDGSRLTITRDARTLSFALQPGKTVAPTLRGLLGSQDGTSANDLSGRDGTVLDRSDPAFATKLYQEFGDSWRVSQGESLFDYGPGESTATFQKPDFPSAEATVASLSPDVRAKANATCEAFGAGANRCSMTARSTSG